MAIRHWVQPTSSIREVAQKRPLATTRCASDRSDTSSSLFFSLIYSSVLNVYLLSICQPNLKKTKRQVRAWNSRVQADLSHRIHPSPSLARHRSRLTLSLSPGTARMAPYPLRMVRKPQTTTPPHLLGQRTPAPHTGPHGKIGYLRNKPSLSNLS